jgi:NADPH-dependent 2,4-dienoyl-CoA reductase/sulfur reductase-like enzyme
LNLTRRQFAGLIAAAGLSGARPSIAAKAQIVVVGGGFGGATAARYLRRLLPTATVKLVEPNARYLACPFSNLVVAGMRSLAAQSFGYDALAAEGISLVGDRAVDVDGNGRSVTLASGNTLSYDRLILSPGIDFRWGALPGYDESAVDRMPHAWKAGPQTLALKRQLAAMEDGGLVVISVTAAPFRCPPGPYERASLIGRFLKAHKPRSRLLILDSNEKFSKQALFVDAWTRLYGDMIQWRNASDDGRVRGVDPESLTLSTDFETIKAAVVNVVPPQQAGLIAERAGCTDETGWCPVDAVSFESRAVAKIHVIGDAIIAAPMPKSAFAANAQAKVCAIQVARMLAGLAPEPTTLANTCYSYVTDDEAISVSGVYHGTDGSFSNVPGAGGVSPRESTAEFRQREAAQARDWFQAVTGEAFGS